MKCKGKSLIKKHTFIKNLSCLFQVHSELKETDDTLIFINCNVTDKSSVMSQNCLVFVETST